MDKNMVFEQLKSRVENVDSIDGTLKFVVDDNAIFIDGTGEKNSISAEDKDADCTISVSSDVLKQLRDGEVNPMMAVMSGKIKISGDMGLAMKVQSLLS
ncbi:MAG: sterol-binding protein [Flavobacteriales bacterium]|jgi:putative sterol carrier protein|nr:sterol-binding protein [Flavobacteriaceae bacterium]MBQ22473.1 sterol-binding protein [Flavobacteriales bacterium]|tara:strand:- start:2606 stop:2902 length:297 start_codon:yes stop_codon:yes gene_type:complete